MNPRGATGDITDVQLDPSQMHVLVFGPGTGEAVVIVLPLQDGDVTARLGVVDGVPGGGVRRWIDKRLGGARLLFACLTHPHADHYAGFARLLEAHPPEHLWWSGDEEGRFFEAWAKAIDDRLGRAGIQPRARSIEVVRRALDQSLKNRRTQTRHRTLADRKRLLTHGKVEVDGLLPTTSEKYDKLREMVCAAKARNGEAVNDLSGAITLRWGETRVLLGGDCNSGSSEDHCGWAGHGERLKGFTLVKVPHHGSDTAHHEPSMAAWENPVGIVTPFQRGGEKQPPTREHLDWWSGRLSRLFITTPKDHMRRRGGDADAFERSEAPTDDNVVVATLDDTGKVVDVRLFGESREVAPSHLTAID